MEPTPTHNRQIIPDLYVPTTIINRPSNGTSVPSVVPVDDTLHREEVAMGANGVNPTQANGVKTTQANGDKPTYPVSEVGQANVIEVRIISQLQANPTN
jgi:hypothetical protein